MGILSNLFNTVQPVIITFNNKTVTVHNKKEAEFYASQFLRIANDSVNLVYNTKNPKVFFERYQLLIEKMQLLSQLEKFRCFSGALPSESLEEILLKKEEAINNFIDRYYQEFIEKINALKTEKAKHNKLDKFYSELSKYNNLMLPNNIEYYTSLYKTNISNINK